MHRYIPIWPRFKLQKPIGVVRSGVTAASVEVVFFPTANVCVRRLEHVRLDTLVVAQITACPKGINAVVAAGLADLVTFVVMMGVSVVQLGPEILLQCRVLLNMKILFFLVRMLMVVMLRVVVVMMSIMEVMTVIAVVMRNDGYLILFSVVLCILRKWKGKFHILTSYPPLLMNFL